jgi:spore coat polysaccharide biosynthesis protein SpsF (cytidylyltransferase family)
MIVRELIRVEKSTLIDETILLTTKKSSDNKLAIIIKEAGFRLFRGSNKNVLKRFYKCSKQLDLRPYDTIVRITGDCPLIDSNIIDETIKEFNKLDVDYISNSIKPIYPDGFDVEVFTFDALKLAYKNAKKLSQKEHVTPYMRDSKLLKIANVEKQPLYPNWRLTVDESSDFVVIQKI